MLTDPWTAKRRIRSLREVPFRVGPGLLLAASGTRPGRKASPLIILPHPYRGVVPFSGSLGAVPQRGIGRSRQRCMVGVCEFDVAREGLDGGAWTFVQRARWCSFDGVPETKKLPF